MSKIKRIRWALRKAVLPVPSSALVLDVGAGACPYPRADVLLERFVTAGHHRCGGGLVADRPLVLGDACDMPFKDHAFDFIIAAHILEHMREPDRFLKELMRVGRAGYIETPNVFLERLSPYSVHVLELMEEEGKLLIRKKEEAIPDSYISSLQLPLRNPRWAQLFFGDPEMFHVRLFWRDLIPYTITNPEQDVSWVQDQDDGAEPADVTKTYAGGGWRGFGLRLLRKYYSLQKRRAFDWLSILACPKCKGELIARDDEYECARCRLSYTGGDTPNFTVPRVCQD